MKSLSPPNATSRITELRAHALAAVVTLLIQYCLGVSRTQPA
jgi:hypothetical protein